MRSGVLGYVSFIPILLTPFYDAEQGNCGLWANDYQVGNLIYEIMTTLLSGGETGILRAVTNRRYYEGI